MQYNESVVPLGEYRGPRSVRSHDKEECALLHSKLTLKFILLPDI